MATIEERLTAAGQDVSELTGGLTGSSSGASSGVNIGQVERWASAIGGGALALYGVTRGSLGGIALALVGAALVQRGATGYCNVYSAMGYSTAGDASLRNNENVSVPAGRGTKVEKMVTIDQPAAELYRFWRNFENLPRFMNHLESVTVRDDKNSHWVVKAPAGRTVTWDAEIINEVENELIAWSTKGDDVDVVNAGSVRFEELPNGRGTEVRVNIEYKPPAGKIGSAIAKLFREEPQVQLDDDLRRFKQVMEAGEVATTEGQSSGRGAK
jgi:uncharacterized membrane protein